MKFLEILMLAFGDLFVCDVDVELRLSFNICVQISPSVRINSDVNLSILRTLLYASVVSDSI